MATTSTLPAIRTYRRPLLAALLILAAVTAGWWWKAAQDGSSQPRVVNRLDRLPARPEDIEAHGAAAQSILPRDDARRRNAAVPFATGPLTLARPFVFAGSDADRAQAVQCLSTAVLYEAGDDSAGEAAVAQVVLNRVRHAAFPSTICGVVYQGAQRATGCQFTFTCDGSLRRTMSDAAWTRARLVAERALSGDVNGAVGLATHYHTNWVYPYWSPQLSKLGQVGTHLFFGWPGRWGGPGAFGRRYQGRENGAGVPAMAIAPVPVTDLQPGENLMPRLPGLPLPPARLPASMGTVPLYGNKLRLVRPDGSGFGLLTAAGAPAEKLVNAALALCGRPGRCEVNAWSNEDDIPGEYPIPAGALDTRVFEYVRGAGKGTLRFDCRIYPNKDPKLCL